MKRLLFLILAAFISCAAFAQADQPANTASIEKLLQLTETRQLYETTMQEMTRMVDRSMAHTMTRLPADRQEKFRQIMAQLNTTLKEEMSWEKMKPQYVRIYAETFTQQEIDDLTAFYKTPSGKSFVKKQPMVIQRTSALSQEKMGIIMERLPALMQQIMAKGN